MLNALSKRTKIVGKRVVATKYLMAQESTGYTMTTGMWWYAGIWLAILVIGILQYLGIIPMRFLRPGLTTGGILIGTAGLMFCPGIYILSILMKFISHVTVGVPWIHDKIWILVYVHMGMAIVLVVLADWLRSDNKPRWLLPPVVREALDEDPNDEQ